jgi:hypothetical protein
MVNDHGQLSLGIHLLIAGSTGSSRDLPGQGEIRIGNGDSRATQQTCDWPASDPPVHRKRETGKESDRGFADRAKTNGSRFCLASLPQGPKMELCCRHWEILFTENGRLGTSIAGLIPAAKENRSGWLNASFTAPKPPIDTPTIARPDRSRSAGNLLSTSEIRSVTM